MAAAVLALASTGTAAAHPRYAVADRTSGTCDQQTLVHHLQRAKRLIRSAYDEDRWRDPKPQKGSEKRRWQSHKHCIRVRRTRRQIAAFRQVRRRAFESVRQRRLEARRERREAREAAEQASSGYAIPESIVQCESGGDYGAVNPSSGAHGAYQIMPSTHAALCSDLGWSPAEQDECAARIWNVQGPGAWVCAG